MGPAGPGCLAPWAPEPTTGPSRVPLVWGLPGDVVPSEAREMDMGGGPSSSGEGQWGVGVGRDGRPLSAGLGEARGGWAWVSAPSPPLGRLQPRCSLDLRAGVGQGQSLELLTLPSPLQRIPHDADAPEPGGGEVSRAGLAATLPTPDLPSHPSSNPPSLFSTETNPWPPATSCPWPSCAPCPWLIRSRS